MRRKTIEEFKEQAISKHGYKYDYSLVDYRGVDYKVKIICPIHGIYEQTPYKHLIGHGCPKCGFTKRAKSKTKWTKNNVFKESRKYTRRCDFARYGKGAYQISLNKGWIEDMDWLNTESKINKHVFLAYIYSRDNFAYIGITSNLKHRDCNHRTSKFSPVYRKWNEDFEGIPSPIILEKGLDAEHAQIQEKYWTSFYGNKGFILLNSAKTGKGCSSLGGKIRKWTKDKIIEDSRLYNSYQEYRNSGLSYGTAKKIHLLNYIIIINNWKRLCNKRCYGLKLI